jgi:DNA-binding transcriptional regulator YiaG
MRQARTITAARYAWLIERLGLNQSSAARFLGISVRQLRRIEDGQYRLDPARAMLLEIMFAQGIAPGDAQRMIGSKPKS